MMAIVNLVVNADIEWVDSEKVIQPCYLCEDLIIGKSYSAILFITQKGQDFPITNKDLFTVCQSCHDITNTQ